MMPAWWPRSQSAHLALKLTLPGVVMAPITDAERNTLRMAKTAMAARRAHRRVAGDGGRRPPFVGCHSTGSGDVWK